MNRGGGRIPHAPETTKSSRSHSLRGLFSWASNHESLTTDHRFYSVLADTSIAPNAIPVAFRNSVGGMPPAKIHT